MRRIRRDGPPEGFLDQWMHHLRETNPEEFESLTVPKRAFDEAMVKVRPISRKELSTFESRVKEFEYVR